MKPTSPYRSLPAEKRVSLVTSALQQGREIKAAYIQRLVAKGGGFRPATLLGWPVDKLAKEFVRLNAQNSQDELELLQLLYVDLEPQYQITFLEAAGVAHENGKMPESLDAPFTTADKVKAGVSAVRAAHGAAGEHYLTTIATYAADGWPGIVDAMAATA